MSTSGTIATVTSVAVTRDSITRNYGQSTSRTPNPQDQLRFSRSGMESSGDLSEDREESATFVPDLASLSDERIKNVRDTLFADELWHNIRLDTVHDNVDYHTLDTARIYSSRDVKLKHSLDSLRSIDFSKHRVTVNIPTRRAGIKRII